MPKGLSPPLPTLVTLFEEFMAAHPGVGGGAPTKAQHAWKHTSRTFAYRMPAGLHRMEHARRRLLQAVR